MGLNAPSPARRWLWIAFGVVLPILCFTLDPLFVIERNEFGCDLWPFYAMARPGTGEAWLLYAIIGVSMAGMTIHAIAPDFAQGRVARPALVLGLIVSLFFSVGIGPAYLVIPFVVLVILTPYGLLLLLGLGPIAASWVYLDAFAPIQRSRRDMKEAAAGAVALIAAALLPYVEFRLAVRDLTSAGETRELARAMDRVERFGPLGRRELARAFLAASPEKRLRMEALSIERRGSSLAGAAEVEMKARRRRRWWD